MVALERPAREAPGSERTVERRGRRVEIGDPDLHVEHRLGGHARNGRASDVVDVQGKRPERGP